MAAAPLQQRTTDSVEPSCVGPGFKRSALTLVLLLQLNKGEDMVMPHRNHLSQAIRNDPIVRHTLRKQSEAEKTSNGGNSAAINRDQVDVSASTNPSTPSGRQRGYLAVQQEHQINS